MKPFIVRNIKKIIDRETFQPLLYAELLFPIERLVSTRCNYHQGLSEETYNKEFVDFLTAELQAGIDKYDAIVRNYYLVFNNDKDFTSSGIKEDYVIIPQWWIGADMGIATCPTFTNFAGEAKENMTHRTSVVIPFEDMEAVMNNDEVLKYHFQKGLDELKDVGMKYYYTAQFCLTTNPSGEMEYNLMIRGAY